MHPHARRLAVLLSPLILVAGCGFSGRQHTIHQLDKRLQAQLAPSIKAGDVALQKLPDGAQVTLLGPSPFPKDTKAADEIEPDVRALVIEGLLDPSLMRIQLADTSALPEAQRNARVADTARYFEAFGLGSTLQPATTPQPMAPAPGSAATAPAAGAAPPGLTITISVQCPPRGGRIGYGSGIAMPVCD